MGKQPKSSTQNTFPPWLMESLKPLIGGATSNAAQFMQQGQNVLQGRPAGGGAPPVAGPQGGGGGFSPETMGLLMRNIAGGPSKGGRRATRSK